MPAALELPSSRISEASGQSGSHVMDAADEDADRRNRVATSWWTCSCKWLVHIPNRGRHMAQAIASTAASCLSLSVAMSAWRMRPSPLPNNRGSRTGRPSAPELPESDRNLSTPLGVDPRPIDLLNEHNRPAGLAPGPCASTKRVWGIGPSLAIDDQHGPITMPTGPAPLLRRSQSDAGVSTNIDRAYP